MVRHRCLCYIAVSLRIGAAADPITGRATD